MAVSDFRFLPATASASQGSLVVWSFIGPSDHGVVDAAGLNLFSSEVQQSGATYSFDFAGSGSYQYTCTGRGAGQCAVHRYDQCDLAPPGVGFDVQVKKPGSSQEIWVAVRGEGPGR